VYKPGVRRELREKKRTRGNIPLCVVLKFCFLLSLFFWFFASVKEKYGFVTQESSSESSSEEEDEDAEGWTSDMEKGFLKTLSMLKNKDPAIYDSAITSFYGNEWL